jgi:hypothetical protein
MKEALEYLKILEEVDKTCSKTFQEGERYDII